MTKDEIILANKEYLFPAVFHYFKEPLVVARAKDQYVWDADGNQYLDFFGGIVTVSVGHCNEQVNEKVHARWTRCSTSPPSSPTNRRRRWPRNRIAYARRPLTKSFFTNSGTEANETAILAARCYTGNTEIVALRHSYHGRTAGGHDAHRVSPRGGWAAAQAGVVHAHNAYCYRCPFGLTYPNCEVRCAQDMEELIRTPPGRVAGFIAEPIQGVGGFITPPKEYFQIVENRPQSRRHLHQRRSADRVGTHRRQVVRHRTLGRHARYHHQRQRPGNGSPSA
jgi:4-aminobutyrate aminotransferase-like enzyme